MKDYLAVMAAVGERLRSQVQLGAELNRVSELLLLSQSPAEFQKHRRELRRVCNEMRKGQTQLKRLGLKLQARQPARTGIRVSRLRRNLAGTKIRHRRCR